MSWQTPKEDWTVASVPGATDFNRIEGNHYDLHIRDGNLSFEYDSNGDGVPDGWQWESSRNGTCQMAAGVDGSYAVKITHPGGSGNGGGRLTSSYISIQPRINNYYITFFLWAAAAMQNEVLLLFFDGSKTYLSYVLVYSSTNNPVQSQDGYFITRIPSLPPQARWCRIRLVGGSDTSATGGSAYFDGIRLFSQLSALPNGTGTVPSFGEITKSSSSATSFTDAIADLAVGSALGYRLGWLPCTVTLTVQAMATGAGGEVRVRCGSEYSTTVSVPAAGSYGDKSLSITITNPPTPLSLAVQFRTIGNDQVWVRRTGTTATVNPTPINF